MLVRVGSWVNAPSMLTNETNNFSIKIFSYLKTKFSLNLQVVDYRTHISGIRAKDIENGEPFGAVQREVINLLKGRILVGHSVSNDLKVLHLKHPYK